MGKKISKVTMLTSIVLLIIANIFMTFAWYGHLKHISSWSLPSAIFISWGIAFFEYCLQVPANRLGSQFYTLAQLKIIQEVITMLVFAVFSSYYMKISLNSNFLAASLCLVAAVYFVFYQPIK